MLSLIPQNGHHRLELLPSRQARTTIVDLPFNPSLLS
jgi:hypothetical protein